MSNSILCLWFTTSTYTPWFCWSTSQPKSSLLTFNVLKHIYLSLMCVSKKENIERFIKLFCYHFFVENLEKCMEQRWLHVIHNHFYLTPYGTLATYLCMESPSEVALPPQAHARPHEEGQQGLIGVKWSLRSRGGSEALGKLSQGPSFQQPLQAGHVLRGRRPPVALLVNARAAAAPGKQVSRTGEGASREEEDWAGDGVSQLVARCGRKTYCQSQTPAKVT